MLLESVMLVEGVGLQLVTRFRNGKQECRLFEWAEIRQILILEAIQKFQFVFFLCIRLLDEQSELVIVFPVPLLFRYENSILLLTFADHATQVKRFRIYLLQTGHCPPNLSTKIYPSPPLQ